MRGLRSQSLEDSVECIYLFYILTLVNEIITLLSPTFVTIMWFSRNYLLFLTIETLKNVHNLQVMVDNNKLRTLWRVERLAWYFYNSKVWKHTTLWCSLVFSLQIMTKVCVMPIFEPLWPKGNQPSSSIIHSLEYMPFHHHIMTNLMTIVEKCVFHV